MFLFTDILLYYCRNCTSGKMAHWCSQIVSNKKMTWIWNVCNNGHFHTTLMYHQMQIYLRPWELYGEIKWPLALNCHLLCCSGLCTLPFNEDWIKFSVLDLWAGASQVQRKCQPRTRHPTPTSSLLDKSLVFSLTFNFVHLQSLSNGKIH